MDMDDFLTPVSQTYLKPRRQEASGFSTSHQRDASSRVKPTTAISSIADGLEQLKSQPDYESLISTLTFFHKGNRIANPTPESAQVIQVLVSDILPNYWTLFKDGDPRDRGLFLDSLRNVTAVNALVSRMKALIQESRAAPKGAQRPDVPLDLGILLEACESLLEGDEALPTIWASVNSHLGTPMKQKAMAHEFTSLFAGGKIVSVAAEANSMVKRDHDDDIYEGYWIADGLQFSLWVGSNIAAWLVKGGYEHQEQEQEQDKLCADLFVRALRLGYSDQLIKHLIELLLVTPDDQANANAFPRLFGHISQLEQKRVLHAVIKYLAGTFLNKLGSAESSDASQVISGAAGVIHRLVGDEENRKTHLVSWLTSSTGAGLGDGIAIRRAILAVMARDKESINTVLEKSLDQFGDQLYIKHSPMLQQEAHAQVLLLSAGYVRRLSPLKLRMLMRSGSYLHTISNRLNASQSKAKIFGMIIGEALSALSDASQTKLDFQMENMETEEVMWYKDLTKVSDDIGPIIALSITPAARSKPPSPKATTSSNKPAKRKTPAPPRTTGFIIEEIEESDDSEDDDLVPYAKPDSDPEDSDDDPTLIRRDKPKAPVYIRDLITYFRDSENYDKQRLALSTAPSLIRRKANYGTEVSAHADELASLLVGLQDKFDLEDFYQLRLQGMMALLVAQPQVMAPWFANTFYEGDYSISQRASILVVLGLSAREIAGFDASEYASAASFPSKRLPERMEKLYLGSSGDHNTRDGNQLPASDSGAHLKALPATALDTIAQSLTTSFLAPLAAEAADTATGPDALKLSSFTSRLEAQGQPGTPGSVSKQKKKPRVRSIPNKTATIISSHFFAPLIARFQHALRTPTQRRHTLLFDPYLLPLYLKTLALLVHAAGPATVSLPHMTSELWDLLLGIRGRVAGDLSSTHALLVALATLLEVNDASAGTGLRRLCVEMPREVVETQEWVAAVFHGTRGEDGGEENQVKMLAAGILITLREAMDKYRALLMGDLIGFE